MRRFALAALFLCNCHHPRGWNVDVPRRAPAIPMDAYLAFPAQLHAGGIKPGLIPADDVSARCVDAAVCSVRLEPIAVKPGFLEVRVYPAHPGDTQVVLDATNRIYGDREHHVLDVHVVEAAPTTPIVVGAAAPRGGQLVDRDAAGADRGHCVSESAHYVSVYGEGEHGVLMYRCSELEAEGRYRLGGTYTLCAQEQDGAVAGVARLAAGESGEYAVTSSSGTFRDRACEPRR